MTDNDILDIVNCLYLTVEMNVISVDTISYSKGLKLNVIVTDCMLKVFFCDSERRHLVLIRHTYYLGRSHAADVNHGRRRQLLYSFCHDIPDKFTQSGKSVAGLFTFLLIFECHIKIESGNIRGTGLHHLRTIYFLRQLRHGHIYLFIYINKEEVDITSGFKIQQYVSAIHAGITAE